MTQYLREVNQRNSIEKCRKSVRHLLICYKVPLPIYPLQRVGDWFLKLSSIWDLFTEYLSSFLSNIEEKMCSIY